MELATNSDNSSTISASSSLSNSNYQIYIPIIDPANYGEQTSGAFRLFRERARLTELSAYVDNEEEVSKASEFTGDDSDSDNNRDFRVYPITIDWNKIQENFEGHVDTKIIKKIGYLGVSLLSKLKRNFKLESDFNEWDFKHDVLDLFLKKKRLESAQNFIQKLPKLSELKEIIEKKVYSRCEFSLVKILLDIYLNFYNSQFFGSEAVKTEVIPLSREFYHQIGENEIRTMNLDLRNIKFKKFKTILNICYSPKEYDLFFDGVVTKINVLDEGSEYSSFLK